MSERQIDYIFNEKPHNKHLCQKNTIGFTSSLKICRAIAQSLGGDLDIKSQPDKGSVFTFWHPISLGTQRPIFNHMTTPTEQDEVSNSLNAEALKKQYDEVSHNQQSGGGGSDAQSNSSESESQFNIDTVHENHNLYQNTMNEDGNIKTTNEVNMDDIVLVQIQKQLQKQIPTNQAKVLRKASQSIMRVKGMKRNMTNNLANIKQRVTFKEDIQQLTFEKSSGGNNSSYLKGSVKNISPHAHLSCDLKVYGHSFEPLVNCSCPKVLIVDDEPFNLITLESMLQQFKVGAVEKAHNGKDAMGKIQTNVFKYRECLRHQCFKIIIIDKKMPLMDGITLGRNIMQMVQDGFMKQKPHMVLLTGDIVDDNPMKEKSKYQHTDGEYIFDQVMPKPLSQLLLVQMLIRGKHILTPSMEEDQLRHNNLVS